MKKVISMVAASTTFLSVVLQTTVVGSPANKSNNNQIFIPTTSNLGRAQEINLSRIKINQFETDLASIADQEFDKQDYLEEIKWAMVDANPDKQDILFDFWDSVLLDYFEQYTFSGLNWEVPKKGSGFLTRVRITPHNVLNYKGTLSFKTTFTNKVSHVEDISNLLPNTNIGTILNNSESELREKVKAKNPEHDIIWNQIRVSDITQTSAQFSAINNSMHYIGSVTINFNIGSHLNDILF